MIRENPHGDLKLEETVGDKEVSKSDHVDCLSNAVSSTSRKEHKGTKL